MLISVVIPAYNEAKLIANSLERINYAFEGWADKHIDKEFIVCDNNSSDNTADIATAWGARTIFEEVNHISRARNTGASIAQGEWLLFVDADSYPTAELINEVIDVALEGTYVGCGSTVEVQGGSLLNKLRMERLNPLFRLFNFCGGVFILCRKEAFEEIGGFSHDLYAYEEIDFVRRLKKWGSKRGQSFTVLYQHPVITSGRKGEYTFSALLTLFVSNFFAVLFFLLHPLLPAKLRPSWGRFLLGYWYKGR